MLDHGYVRAALEIPREQLIRSDHRLNIPRRCCTCTRLRLDRACRVRPVRLAASPGPASRATCQACCPAPSTRAVPPATAPQDEVPLHSPSKSGGISGEQADELRKTDTRSLHGRERRLQIASQDGPLR